MDTCRVFLPLFGVHLNWLFTQDMRQVPPSCDSHYPSLDDWLALCTDPAWHSGANHQGKSLSLYYTYKIDIQPKNYAPYLSRNDSLWCVTWVGMQPAIWACVNPYVIYPLLLALHHVFGNVEVSDSVQNSGFQFDLRVRGRQMDNQIQQSKLPKYLSNMQFGYLVEHHASLQH